MWQGIFLHTKIVVQSKSAGWADSM